jgi:flagellar hook-associated protein 1 FlgK
MAGLLSIGVSGLLANQTALTTTGNNIANANVEGYSRQRTEFGTQQSQQFGPGYIGNGVLVTGIKRVVEDYTLTQLRLDTSNYNNLDTLKSNLDQIDSLLAGEDSGLAPGIEAVFAALEAAASDPTSIPIRQLVLSESDGLSQRFHTIYERLQQQNIAVNDRLDTLTEQISALAVGLADINTAISLQGKQDPGSPPNDLFDARDEKLRQLSELVSVSTTFEDTGVVNVFIGNGQPLVVGSVPAQLETGEGSNDPISRDIIYKGLGTTITVTDFITGGTIGGLLEFRNNELTEALNGLGRIAISLSESINQLHNNGLDLNGAYGLDLFSDINTPIKIAERVVSDSRNALPVDRVVTATINNVQQLTTDNYIVQLSNPDADGILDYQVLRESDGVVLSAAEFPAAGFPQSIVIDGMSIDLTSGTFQSGDKFFIRPTTFGARDISLNLSRPQQLALALPIRTENSLGNVGKGAISAGSIIDVYSDTANTTFLPAFATPGQLSPPILIRFTNATTYSVYNNTNAASPVLISAGNGFTPGQNNKVFADVPGVGYTGYQVELSGFPSTGDEFKINFNANGISDNRNAAALSALRIAGSMNNGSTSFEEAYGQLIEEIGSRTAQVGISLEAADSLLLSSTAIRDSISGVNLDEEAANLIRFEQAYNASAQIINVARQVFDTLLAAFR